MTMDAVKALLAAGADPNLTMENGDRALTFAVVHDDAEMVKALLSAGADTDGETLLILAMAIRDDTVVTMLKNAGAKPHEVPTPEHPSNLPPELLRQ